MVEHIITIKEIGQVTHDVKRFQCERPAGYNFLPGQATEVSINKPEWKEEKRPFTFTSLTEAPDLEFVIKIYKDHPGVTNELDSLRPGDELIIRDVWGAIEYKGPGYFIAGGAGITPFIAILRMLRQQDKVADNKLFFSNKTDNDIILREELGQILGKNVIHVITDAKSNDHLNGMINEEFLKRNIVDFSRFFYLCGPPRMVGAVGDCLEKLGARPDSVVFEK